jgi:hypothetical protein
MSMVCPQCNQVFEQQERICPTCSIQLLFFARIAPTTATAAVPVEDTSGRWQHSGVGRIIIGLILAQGLALGLKQLFTAALLAGGNDATVPLWGTVTGLALLHGLHAVGLLIGGALAGAGQERGVFNGAIVGFGSGIIFLFLQPQAIGLLDDLALYCQPLLHLLVGAFGACIGKAIWRPTARLVMPEIKTNSPPAPPVVEMLWLHGPIAWWRVVAGSTIMTCGVIWSNLMLNWLVDTAQGVLTVTTHFQAKLISAEIAALTMFAGACLAGATTWNGAKQGLCVGIGGVVLYLGFEWANPQAQLETAVFAISCMLSLGLAGGWFGGHLFPPLGRAPRVRRIIDL